MISRLEADPTGQNARLGTDIRAIDMICGGFPFGHPTMIGGRPSNGKTLLMRTILDNLGRRGIPGGYVSLEDAPIDMVQWQCLRRARIGIERIIQGRITPAEIKLLKDLRAEVASLPIAYCREASLTGPQICQRIRQMIAQRGIRIAFVDYLQLVKLPNERNTSEELSDVVQMLSTVAHDNGIAMVIGSQLNRENEREKRPPALGDFKACGGIEEAAELAILVHRQWRMKPDPQKPRYAKLLEAIVAKMKLGEPGIAKLYMEGALGYACDPEPGYFAREMDGPVEFCASQGCERYALWGEKFCGLHKTPSVHYASAPAPRDWHDTDSDA
jgi:replicative DNA helicase